MLFDAPEPLAQRAERVAADNGLPLIIVDESRGSDQSFPAAVSACGWRLRQIP